MPIVKIYYAHVCGLCTQALEFFRSRNATFTAFAVEWDAANDKFVDSANTRAMYKKCGEVVEFVPQIFIDGIHIRGWRTLEPMIASGEIDRLIPKPQ